VPGLIEAVKRGVMLAGGLRWSFPPSRSTKLLGADLDVFAQPDVDRHEEMVRAQPMDAVVVIGGCDKTFRTGAWARSRPTNRDRGADRPDGGRPLQGRGARGVHRLRPVGQHRAGKMDEAEMEVVSGRLAPSVGTAW